MTDAVTRSVTRSKEAPVSEAITLQSCMTLVGNAIRRPEQLVLRWRDRAKADPTAPAKPISPAVFIALTLSAVVSLATYGFTMGIPMGLHSMWLHALLVPAVALAAWTICLPALYILNTARGSTLDPSTTVLAALTALHFGALARLASAPLSWFFGLAVPIPMALTAIHFLVFGVTALFMLDVFLRIVRTVSPGTTVLLPLAWICLVGLIDMELKGLLSVFAL